MEVTRTLLNKASEFLLGATSSVGENHIVMCMEELTLEILRTDGRVMEMETQRPSRSTRTLLQQSRVDRVVDGRSMCDVHFPIYKKNSYF